MNRNAITLLPVVATLLLLPACGKQAEQPGAGSKAGTASMGVASNGKGDAPGDGVTKNGRTAGSDNTLDRALTCWGLTNRAYFMHQAIKSGDGNLPAPSPLIYRAWSNLAATTANAGGMTLAEYETRQKAAQKAATVYSLNVKADHAAAVQTCIDTAPALGPDPELTWPDP